MSDLKDEELKERIKNMLDKEPLPKDLEPEQIERKLQRRTLKNSRWRPLMAGIASAAAFAVVTAVVLNSHWARRGAGWDESAKGVENSAKAEMEAAGKIESGSGQVLPEGLKQAESYEKIQALLNTHDRGTVGTKDENYGGGIKEILNGVVEEPESLIAGGDGAQESDGIYEAEEDYSQTNIQEEGVGEADLLLTDGTYLYARSRYEEAGTKEPSTGSYCFEDGKYWLTRYSINIIKPDPVSGKLTRIAEIKFNEEEQGCPEEMYLYQDKLAVITSKDLSTAVVTYDITDRANPVLLGRAEAEGGYRESRLVDGCLYLFTQYTKYNCRYTGGEEAGEGFIPCVQGEKLGLSDIYIPEIQEADGYLVGISVMLDKPQEAADRIAVLVNNSRFYVSPDHIYFAAADYRENSSTSIYKFSYKDGQMEPAASGTVKGTINDSFSMDEYNGYLRMVTTSTTEQQPAGGISNTARAEGPVVEEEIVKVEEDATVNNLYVLDAQLNIVGRIEDLAKGERIYSARFMGDTGFFVTYREMDPLFSVDLSNPASPVILGELKVSGFSEYLHPYGENRLLGIGWETRSSGFGDGEMRDAMKLSMFNTTDMSNVTEENRLLLNTVLDTPVVYDHRAVMINAQKNLFGMAVEVGVPAFGASASAGSKIETHYLTFRYVEGVGFEQLTDTKLSDGYYFVSEIRGAYIKEILYILDSQSLRAVSLADGSLLDTLELK